MNNINLGLDHLVGALKKNSTIICVKLRNNNIDGRRFHNELFQLANNHPSLVSIDLGNSEHIKNRNRLYNEGLSSLIEGIINSKD